jgi:hypothetical protein
MNKVVVRRFSEKDRFLIEEWQMHKEGLYSEIMSLKKAEATR